MRLEDGFLAWAERDPALPAIVAGGDKRSYGQLHDQAAELAAIINDVVGPERARIGLFLDRGPDGYTAILATLLANALYVPINPGHPPARIARTIELADLDLIVADDVGWAGIEQLPPTTPRPPVLTLGLPHQVRQRKEVGRSDNGKGAEELAYLLFTSGTTGDPKGVPISHGNVTAFLADNLEHYRFGPGDRCSQTFDLTFDLSVFDIFMTLSSGACLYPLRSTDLLAPVDFVADHGLSVWFSVPAVAALQRQRGALKAGAMPSLRTSLFCGEALSVDVATAWVDAAPNSVAENLYGPTELTIACTRHRFAPTESRAAVRGPIGGLVPIGQPFGKMDAVVVGAEGRPVEAGQEGELCLTGPQRFSGYWRAPEKTAARTLTIDGTDYYRTGDRVVEDGDLLHFIGRFDDQVQVLGHRVELGEVEAAARSLDDVIDAVAVPLPVGGSTVEELGLAVTLAVGSTEQPRQLRRSVASRVPNYMAPRRVCVLDRFSLNANGKIDRLGVANQAFGEPARAVADDARPAGASR